MVVCGILRYGCKPLSMATAVGTNGSHSDPRRNSMAESRIVSGDGGSIPSGGIYYAPYKAL